MADGTPIFGPNSQVTINESALPEGTAPGATPLSGSGFFTLQAASGIASATIDGRSFISGGVFTPITDTTPQGQQLRLESFDSATGRVTYTYTLIHAVNAPSRPDVSDAPALAVTAGDGGQASGVLAGLTIHDDAPIAGSSINYIVPATGPSVRGNLLTGYASNGSGTPTQFGADGGGHITASYAGTVGGSQAIGTLTGITASGDYTFTINAKAWLVGAYEDYTFGVADADGSGAAVTVRFVIGADDKGDLLSFAANPIKIGGGGDDTLIATSARNTLTGGGGHDLFQVDQFADITDFTVGTDRLDLSKVFAQLPSPYTGSDPVADGVVRLASNGAGGASVQVVSGGAAHDVAILRGVDPNGVTYAQLANGPPPSAPPAGQVFKATGSGNETLSGTSGSDTFSAGANSVSITAGAGSDIVIFDQRPFNAGHIKDFAVSEDHLNVQALLDSIGYTGSDPVADGYIVLNDDHRGNTNVWFDPDAGGRQNIVTLTTLDGVFRPGLTGAEILTRHGSDAAPPPPGPGGGGDTGGKVLTGNDTPGQALTGGAGNDTLIAGHNSVVETGGSGADVFAFDALPWNAGHVTDFTVGTDRLDLSKLLAASGFSGSDPIAGGYVVLQANGAGGTTVFYDTDGPGTGNTIQFKITDLDHVAPGGLTWAQLSGSAGEPPPSGGRVITADDTPGQALTGGAGNDTLNAGHNSVVETGGGGADVFAFGALPWNAGHITDFTVGTDRLDLSQLLAASGYVGADPIADGYVALQADGAGGTSLFYDTDGRASGNTIQFKITTLDHISPAGLTWSQLSEPAGGPPPQPGAPRFETTLVSHAEGDSSPRLFEYAVSRTSTDQPARLFWAVSGSGDHPAGPQDFTGGNLPNGYVEFAAGQVQARFLVSVAGDTDVEPDEGFTVSLAEPGGSIFARASGLIQNDDASTSGQVINSQRYGDTLIGGAGNDTLNAGRGPDMLTGGNGADHFAWAELPWNPGHVTDFAPGVDLLDLRALFAAAGYSGSDPIGDGYLQFVAGGGGTQVRFDPDGPAQGVVYPYTVATLDNVAPASITPEDWLFR